MQQIVKQVQATYRRVTATDRNIQCPINTIRYAIHQKGDTPFLVNKAFPMAVGDPAILFGSDEKQLRRDLISIQFDAPPGADPLCVIVFDVLIKVNRIEETIFCPK